MNNKTPDEIIEALERLQRLKESGLLSDDEVAQQKAEILANQKAAFGPPPGPTDILSVRPETLKKISKSQRSGGGRRLLWAVLALGVLGVGGYFGAQALNIEIPGLPILGSPAPTQSLLDLDVSTGNKTITPDGSGKSYAFLEIQSRMDSVTMTDVIVNKGNCDSMNWYPSGVPASETGIGKYFASEAPPHLDFGQRATLLFSKCDIIEVTILAVEGGATYTFQ